MATGGVAAVAASIPGAEHPDAALLAACAEWERLYEEGDKIIERMDAAGEDWVNITFESDFLTPVFERVMAIPVRGMAGVAAKLSIFATDDGPSDEQAPLLLDAPLDEVEALA
ncbi:hypothetical protein BH10PSE7_BH10PSE7_17920 [soil metagenome]